MQPFGLMGGDRLGSFGCQKRGGLVQDAVESAQLGQNVCRSALRNALGLFGCEPWASGGAAPRRLPRLASARAVLTATAAVPALDMAGFPAGS
jgi:hypothetical protein